jgi:hypothetical protein
MKSDIKQITVGQASELIVSMNKQDIFYVEYTKRTTGELRKMTCRKGVKKHLKGGEKAYSDREYDLMTVFDMDKVGYRAINLREVKRLTINKEQFIVVEEG